MSTFTPLQNYAGYSHVPMAGAVWIHPSNGNAYCCAVEKDQGGRQDLSVYRLKSGASAWELVKRYEGTVDSAAQVTFGGAAVGMGGALLVVTSLIIPGAPKVTAEGFQGVWTKEPNIDDPWSPIGTSPDLAALIARIDLQQRSIDAQTAITLNQQRQIDAMASTIAAIESEISGGGGSGSGLTTAQLQTIAWATQMKNALANA